MHQLRVLRFNNNPHLTGSIPTAWFPPLGGDDDDAAAARRPVSVVAGARARGTWSSWTAEPHTVVVDRSFAREPWPSWLATLRLGGNRLEGAVPGSVTRPSSLRALSLRLVRR